MAISFPSQAASSSFASSSASTSALAQDDPLHPITIEAQLPQGKKYLFIRGEGRGLHPDRGSALSRIGPNRWTTAVTQTSQWTLWVDELEPLETTQWSQITCNKRVYAIDEIAKNDLFFLNTNSSISDRTLAKNHITQDPLCPEEIKNYLNDHPVTHAYIGNDTFPQIAVPSDKLLQKMVDHYQDKYGITIHICTVEQFIEHLNQSPTPSQFEGFIIPEDTRAMAHVVPVILNARKEAVILDSTGLSSFRDLKDGGSIVRTLCHYINKADIEIFFSCHIRQADHFSCHTDALIILRNILLDLKQTPVKNLREKVHPITKDKLTSDQRADLKYIATSFPIHIVNLPLSWDYSNQISNKQPGAETTYIPRDLFSHSKAKQKNPRTVEQFRNQHTQLTKNYTSILLRSVSTIPSSKSKNNNTTIYYSNNNRFPEIIKTEKKPQNTYLAFKAFKIAEKHGLV